MKALTISIFNYIKNPKLKPKIEHLSFKQKIQIVFACVILCVVVALCLSILTAILEVFDVYNPDEHAINKLFENTSTLYIILTAVIFAPLIEEFIFRGPLIFFSKKHFKIGFYILAILFGYLHIFNFEITKTILVFSPILVLPQMILGLIFGYIRVRLGLLYSIILHMCYNGVLLIPALLILK